MLGPLAFDILIIVVDYYYYYYFKIIHKVQKIEIKTHNKNTNENKDTTEQVSRNTAVNVINASPYTQCE